MIAWITTLFKLVLSSKFTTILGLVAAFIGLLTKPEFAGVVPVDWSAWLASAGTVVATLARSLVDADGNGIPDVIDHLLGRPTSGHASVRLVVLLTLSGMALVALLRVTRMV